MAPIPQLDALMRDIIVTYNDPRLPANGRNAYRGTLIVYVGSDGYAVLLSKQGDGPTEWLPVIPPPTGNVNQFLRGDFKWSEQAGFSNGFMAASQLQPIAGPALLGNAGAGVGTVAALGSAQARSVIGMQVTAKTADTGYTSTAFSDVPVGASGTPTLGFDLLANQRYHFRFVTLVSSSNDNVGPGLTVTTPTYSVFGAAAMMIGQFTAGPSVIFSAPITTSQTPAVAAGVATAGLDYVFVVEGVIVPNASGRLTLQARIETGTATITIRQGSFGLLLKE